MMTKMPVPMTAPMPSAVRSRTPTAALEAVLGVAAASPARDSWDLRAKGPGRRGGGHRSPHAARRVDPIGHERRRFDDRVRHDPSDAAATVLGFVPEFRLDPIFTPAADQPKAIDEIAAARRRRRALRDAARRHRHRQDDDDGGRSSSACSARRSCSPTTRRSPRSCATSSARSSPTTRSSTSSPTTTTTSPRPTSRRKDLYIEKDSAINQEVDRLRHAATAALFARRDVIIVASVSAIFGLGSPETYDDNLQVLRKGDMIDRDKLLRKLVSIQYTRNDTALGRGTLPRPRRGAGGLPRLRRVRLPRDAVRRRGRAPAALRPADRRAHRGRPRARRDLAGDALQRRARARSRRAVEEIGRELNERCAELEAEGKLLE